MPENAKGRPPAKVGRPRNASRCHLVAPKIAPAGITIADLPRSLADRVTTDGETGCWKAGGYLDRDGYARYAGQQAHRWVWLEYVGNLPPGKPVLDHVKARGCRWRCCIWPAHLEPVTIRENTMRGTSFAAVNAAKTECDYGHPFDLFNTRFNADGSRDCRRCDARRQREYQARQRGQLDGLERAA